MTDILLMILLPNVVALLIVGAIIVYGMRFESDNSIESEINPPSLNSAHTMQAVCF